LRAVGLAMSFRSGGTRADTLLRNDDGATGSLDDTAVRL